MTERPNPTRRHLRVCGPTDSRPVTVSTHQNVAPTDGFGDHMPNYRRGRAWLTLIVLALGAATEGKCLQAHQTMEDADRILYPLGDLSDPSEVRDFIAGSAREAEDMLAHISSSGSTVIAPDTDEPNR